MHRGGSEVHIVSLSRFCASPQKQKLKFAMEGKKQDDILRKHLGGANVPEELLLTPSETSTPSESEEDICGPHSLSEKGLRSFCMKYLDGNDMEMQVVI
mmetsp:Transcript_8126/g.14677  ORF Transcript_8126/g.14677 Transcript_8126/m.14677 type:complete len:99 (+) Transcript_8126:1127-1423(+)